MKRQQKYPNAENQGFIIYESIIRMSSFLSDEELGRLIRQFYLYAEQGEAPGEEPNLAVAIIAQASSFAATARSPPISSSSPESPLPTTPSQLLLMTTALFERLVDRPRNPSRWKQSNLEATISFFRRNNIISF